jgi:hypothetical protein
MLLVSDPAWTAKTPLFQSSSDGEHVTNTELEAPHHVGRVKINPVQIRAKISADEAWTPVYLANRLLSLKSQGLRDAPLLSTADALSPTLHPAFPIPLFSPRKWKKPLNSASCDLPATFAQPSAWLTSFCHNLVMQSPWRRGRNPPPLFIHLIPHFSHERTHAASPPPSPPPAGPRHAPLGLIHAGGKLPGTSGKFRPSAPLHFRFSNDDGPLSSPARSFG